MGGLLSKAPEPTAEDKVMASLVIPVCLEKNLALGDGSTEEGCPLSKALQFDQNEVPNLYSISAGEFKLCFQEHGVAYNESAPSDCLVEASVELHQGGGGSGFSFKVDPSPVQMWGLNFAGRVLIKHESGPERVIYLPGTRTYDPAGITGDPHASERIGPSCSRTQVGITIAELMVALREAEQTKVSSIQEKLCPLVKRYHGREVLFNWMKMQLDEAVYKNVDVTPYPEYIKALIRGGSFELGESREHTRAYLDSYNRGMPHPPLQYYQKVAKKDKVDEILTGESLATFKKLVE